MSSIDPAVLAAMQAASAAQAAIAEATLTLGIDAAALQVRTSVGDVLSATVLAPQSGTDLLEILGHTVQAQLPPGIYPGETLALQVTGFDVGRIVVRNLGTIDPAALPPSARPLTFAQKPNLIPQAQNAPPVPGATASLRGVVVAASIRAQAPASTTEVLQPQARVLARLRLPQTPITLAAAKIVSEAATAVPRAFARLATLLAKSEVSAQAAPLRTLLPFLTKLDPSNPRALPEQIAAYVENVVDGGEGKLVTLLDAYRAADTSQAPQPQVARQQPTALETVDAQIAAGRAALETDVKTALLSLASAAPDFAPAESAAVRQALVAVTAAQIAALSSAAENPNAITLALPVFYHEGGRPTEIRINRDAPKRGVRMDPDNFHIGFVLDTAALGTLAIDLETVGRSVRVSVKAERERHARRVEEMLPNLCARLEALRYRVASARADAASLRGASAVPPPTAAPTGEARLDLRA